MNNILKKDAVQFETKVPHDFFTEAEAAKYLRCSTASLRQMRKNETGPKYCQPGGMRKALYRPEDLRVWMEEQVRE